MLIIRETNVTTMIMIMLAATISNRYNDLHGFNPRASKCMKPHYHIKFKHILLGYSNFGVNRTMCNFCLKLPDIPLGSSTKWKPTYLSMICHAK